MTINEAALKFFLSMTTTDSSGNLISPDIYPHVYTYNTDGTLATDSFTDGISIWIKTFGYTNSVITSETAWVKQ